MIGALVGDIVGSIYEFDNHRSKEFPLYAEGCKITDDSIMTLAIAKAILESKPDHSDLGENAVKYMREIGRKHPDCGYGGRFGVWMFSENPVPYNSYGNGSAMRVSPVAYAAKSLDEVKLMSRLVTEVTHNHPEGIKGAEATAVAVWMALHMFTKGEIIEAMEEYYDFGFTLNGIRRHYSFNETCQGSVPQALEAFFEAEDFEDAIRNAISIGGDSDTIASITGAIAGAYWPIPMEISSESITYLDYELANILIDFHKKYPKWKMKELVKPE